MRRTFRIPIDDNVYDSVVDSIHNTLRHREKDRRNVLRVTMATEEALSKMLEHRGDHEGEVKLVVAKTFGNVRVTISCPGEEFELFTDEEVGWSATDDEMGEASQVVLREILIDNFSQNLGYRHKDGVNTVTVKGKENEYAEIYLTLACLVAGIAFGFIMKVVLGDAFSAGLMEYVLDPIRTMFLNALSILVGPVVFFSMVCCISNFASLADIGKIGARVIRMYLLTTIIAVCLGFGLYALFPIGNPSLVAKSEGALATMDAEEMEEMDEAVEAAEGGVSIIDTIVGIIAENIVTPFMENNLLQLIFLGIFMGVGVSALRDKHPELRPFFVRFSDLFMEMLEMLCKFIPVAVFCNMACLVYSTGTDVLMSILSYVVLCATGILSMICVYHILIAFLAHLNPLVFTRHYLHVMLSALTLSSSTAVLPMSMEECRKIGVSDKVVSLSIPLGSTINMDGSSLVMSIICMFMASVYGLEITPTLLVTILVSIILLSLGAPSMAGADLAIIVVLLSQIGIPTTAMALIMGVDTLLDMMQAMCNTTSDAAIALIVAKRSSELDQKLYR